MIPSFALARPATIAEALDAFDAADGDAAWYAGGTELLQVMKMGLARYGTLIDLKRLPELQGITVARDGALVIGGAVTHREIEGSAAVARELPALAALEGHVANVRVRNQGTLGGNLCFAEPHSDPATFLLAAGARVRLQGRNGTRELTIDELVVGPLETARAEDELLAAVVVPAPARGEGREEGGGRVPPDARLHQTGGGQPEHGQGQGRHADRFHEAVGETARDAVFCAGVAQSGVELIVPDTLHDERFADAAVVTGGPRIRFYAGVPLLQDDGECVGTFCIADTRPRELEEEDLTTLRDLADLALQEIKRSREGEE